MSVLILIEAKKKINRKKQNNFIDRFLMREIKENTSATRAVLEKAASSSSSSSLSYKCFQGQMLHFSSCGLFCAPVRQRRTCGCGIHSCALLIESINQSITRSTLEFISSNKALRKTSVQNSNNYETISIDRRHKKNRLKSKVIIAAVKNTYDAANGCKRECV